MMHRRMALSAFTNWLAFAATLLVAFFISPYLIRTLGASRYGVWVFVESILAYFTLFDLGIAACVVRYVARFHAAGSQVELNKLVSSCLALFLGLGLIALALGAALSPVLIPLLDRTSTDAGDTTLFLLLMLGNLAVTLPLSVFPSILDGLERFALKSAVRIVFLVLRTTATIILMEHEPSLLGLGVIFTVGNLAEHLVFAVLCRVRLPDLRISYRLVDRATLQLVRGYSVDAFLAMIAGRVSVQSGAIIIGIFLSAPEITWFAIALRLVEFAKALLRSATTTLTPAISSLEAAGDHAAIGKVLLRATRWVLYLILPVHLGLILFGRPFLTVWLGSPEYAEKCYPALMILSATLSLVVAQSVASRILYGMGRLRLFARMSLVESGINVTLSLLLVRAYGLNGVAWAAMVPNAFFCLFVIGYTCRLLGQPIGEYLGTAWLRPLLAAVLPLAAWMMVSWEVNTWLTLAAAIALGLLPYVLTVALMEGLAARLRLRFNGMRRLVLRSVT